MTTLRPDPMLSATRPAARRAPRVFAIAVACIALASHAVGATAPEDGSTEAASGPGMVVERLQADLLDIMKRAKDLGYQGRYDALGDVIERAFDLDFMAEKSVGRHWRKLSEGEQQRWLDAFRRLTRSTYADRFEGFSGQHFETTGEEDAAHDTRVVRTKLVIPNDEDVELNYRLHEGEQGWRIIDVYMNGTVSELALRRSEYSTVLKREGFEKLIATVDDKTQKTAAGAIQ